ncbi:restriction endonuclease subunit S, partial [Lachnospira eligens]|uniref:restriction endonuclease subunit S n=1 Tax=Lachnospira eligens TaxID=39485 RepID=UPI0032C015F9
MKKTFEEVVLFARTGLNPRQNFKLGQGNNNYITIKNIKNNSLVIDDNTDVVDDEAIKLIHKRSQIKKGDVLFASIGRMGDMFIIEEEPIGWDINESVFAFTLNTNIVKQKYFYYIFRVKSTLDYLISNSSGSTFKSIKMNQLKKMVFDIPQLEEQDYIISVLDKVCDVIEKRKQELEFLDNLIKARFVEMFGDPIINSFGWKIVNIFEV